MPARILVDIDATLYDSAPLWAELFARFHGIALKESDVVRWDWWRDFVSDAEFEDLIKAMHARSSVMSRRPFDGAPETIRRWHDQGIEIHIASDRATSSARVTGEWLRRHGIPYDHLICRRGIDKVEYAVEHGLGLIIDDRPDTIERAVAASIPAATLIYPYNRLVVERNPQVIAAKSWPKLATRIEKRFGSTSRRADA
jgi:uncharacterized HAD superfamily protein